MPKNSASVPATWGQQDRRFGESIKGNLDTLLGHRGDKLDKAVTFRDLLDSGIISLASGVSFFNGGSSEVVPGNALPEFDVPPAPTGLAASGAFENIILTWDQQRYYGHSYFEIHRNTSDSVANATLLAVVSGFQGIYSDPVGGGQTFYYWVRTVNQNGVESPFNAVTGVSGTTAPDVTFLLSTLSGAITSSELASSLSTPISQITGFSTSISAINGNITTINGNITQLDNFVGFDSSYSGNSLLTRMGAVETTANGAATSAQLQSEQTTRATADSALSSSITTLQSTVGVNAAAIQTEQTARASADSAIASDVTSLTTTVSNNAAAISTETTARSNADSALASDITSLNTSTGNNAAAISAETTARSNADSALATDITTLTTSVSGNSTSIQTQATSVNGLSAQYTVKIDTNGAVAGYGLASTSTAAGNITSEFIVNADRFAIMRGGSNSTAAVVPFIVQASATTINGVAVPAGVYMADAFIQNGSIVNAKIGNLAVDNAKISSLDATKINAGTINTARLNIDNNYLSEDGNGQLILVTSNGTNGIKVENLSNDAVGTLHFSLGAGLTATSNQSYASSLFFTGDYTEYVHTGGFPPSTTTYTIPQIHTTTLSKAKLQEPGSNEYHIDFKGSLSGSSANSNSASEGVLILHIERSLNGGAYTSVTYQTTSVRLNGSFPLGDYDGMMVRSLDSAYDHKFTLYGYNKGISGNTSGNIGWTQKAIRVFRINATT